MVRKSHTPIRKIHLKPSLTTSVVYLQQYYLLCHALIFFSIHFQICFYRYKIDLISNSSGKELVFEGFGTFLDLHLWQVWLSTFFKTVSRYCGYKKKKKKAKQTQVYHVGTLGESLEKNLFFPQDLTHDFWAHELDSSASFPPLQTLTLHALTVSDPAIPKHNNFPERAGSCVPPCRRQLPLHYAPSLSFAHSKLSGLPTLLRREGSPGSRSGRAAAAGLGTAPVSVGLEKGQGAADDWAHINGRFTLTQSFLQVAEGD